jgi:putative ABC transport system permease protein
MLMNYVTIALRSLARHKLYSLINLLGLASGIACFILIALFVHNEMTFDRFHRNASDIYLIHQVEKSQDGDHAIATSPDPLADALKNDCPGLAHVVRFFGNEFPVTANGKTFKERLFCTTPPVFEMFTFPLAEGDPSTALATINSAVVTQELAERYFGNADPMGKTLTLMGHYDFLITGVLKKLPENSSIKFGMLLPEAMLRQVMPDVGTKWYSAGSYTFVQCSEKLTPAELEHQLPLVIRKYVPGWLQGRMGLGMERLTDIHLTPGMDFEGAPAMSGSYLVLLFAISLGVLLIACFNYMNLATARYSDRAREIGLRKVVGASRAQLVSQFIGESVVMSFLALLLGLACAELFLPEFNTLTGRRLDISYGYNLIVVPGLIAFGLLVGIIAGSYPALFLTSRRVIDSLKGEHAVSGTKISFRSSLVLVQFVVSTALIIAVLIVTAQLQFMRHHSLGFDPSAMLVIPTHASDLTDPLPKIHAYMNSIDKRAAGAGIVSSTLSEHVPGYYFNNRFGVVPEGWGDRHPLEMIVTSIDENFLESFKMEITEGRNFSRAHTTDESQAVLFNETAARRIGWTSPIGKQFRYVHGEGPFTVVGVVKDIHFQSLQTPIEPQIYRFAAGAYQMGFISLRIRPDAAAKAIASLREEWGNVMKDAPFEYFFVADKYAASYQEEERVQEIVGIASFLAILLASLGLLGLVSLAVNQRTKEIGIRKVLGATIADILVLLSKRFVVLVLAANLIAWPLTYYAMNRWLLEYPYRIDMGPGLFLTGAALALLLALLAVGSQAIRAALSNPVESLRYE